MKKFKIGEKYSMSSPCDHNCIWLYTVIDRTGKSIMLKQVRTKGIIRRKIYKYNDCEYCMPLGCYSMAPTLRAN